jgi:hypothetical protein
MRSSTLVDGSTALPLDQAGASMSRPVALVEAGWRGASGERSWARTVTCNVASLTAAGAFKAVHCADPNPFW